MKQISILTGLQLKNIYGINVYRHTKDKKERNRKFLMAIAYVFIAFVVAFYVGAMGYAYIYIGLESVVPSYFIMIASLVILFFSIFKAGNVIFQRNAYDILSSLPVSQMAIVVSRFIRMYVENLVVACVVVIPSMVVYGVATKVSVHFYIIGALTLFFIPVLPITISSFIGALITAIASRMKRKSLVSAALSLVLIVGVFVGTSSMTTMSEEISLDMLKALSGMVSNIIEDIYPPAIWLGNAMLQGNYIVCVGCIVGVLIVFLAVMCLISANFHSICRRLYSTSAKHSYKMSELKTNSVLSAMCMREFKRYFSSSTYLTNTIIGPIMAVFLSGSILDMGVGNIEQMLGLPIDIGGVIPFVLAGVFSIMPASCSAISMEGKEWWIVKTLPVKVKEMLDAKLLFNLGLILPFYVVSEILLIIAIKPNWLQLLWLVMIPAIMVTFSVVFGLFINLKLPVFNWENEIYVVKQSTSALIGAVGGLLVVIVAAVPVLIVPTAYGELAKVAISTVIILITLVMYGKINKTNLTKL